MTITVRAFKADDEAAFKSRWEQYNVFYKRTIPRNVTATTIKRFLDPNVESFAAVAVDSEKKTEGGVVGFVTWLPHLYTGSIEPVVYLGDLFVDPDARNGGIGKALIAHVDDHAQNTLGAKSVYWHTQTFNHRAQLLYTKVAERTDFIKYAQKF